MTNILNTFQASLASPMTAQVCEQHVGNVAMVSLIELNLEKVLTATGLNDLLFT